MELFAKRLRAEREQLKQLDSKWTQGYVAGLIDVARPTYTAYENGTKQPPMDTMNKIADLFDVEVDYLYGRTNKPRLETNMSFYGGPEKYSPDEIALMEATLKAYREQKDKLKEDQQK